MAEPRMAIAIDGPAASGKSSTARAVARELGFRHLDSGALYRAATAARARRGGPAEEWTEESVIEAARIVTLEPCESGFTPLLGARSDEAEIRGHEVTRHVSRVARMPAVREWVNSQLRRVGAQYDVVADGRDMGTVVFPHAALKVYLVADPHERARRRLKERGLREPTAAEIAEETALILQRDERDAEQSRMASDAVLIDTTSISQDEQVARIVLLARVRRPVPGLRTDEAAI